MGKISWGILWKNIDIMTILQKKSEEQFIEKESAKTDS